MLMASMDSTVQKVMVEPMMKNAPKKQTWLPIITGINSTLQCRPQGLLAQRSPQRGTVEYAQIDFDDGIDHRGKGRQFAEGDKPVDVATAHGQHHVPPVEEREVSDDGLAQRGVGDGRLPRNACDLGAISVEGQHHRRPQDAEEEIRHQPREVGGAIAELLLKAEFD